MPRRLRISRLKNLTLQVDSGVFSWAGNNATLTRSRAYLMQAIRGTYSWTGNNATLTRQNFLLKAVSGVFTWTKNTATLIYTPVSTLGWSTTLLIPTTQLQQGSSLDFTPYIVGNQALISSITPSAALPTGVAVSTSAPWRLNASLGAILTPPFSESFTIVPGGTVSIASFGAVSDGTTNNSTAIANAIASAKSLGLHVLVPAGTWAYGADIELDGVQMDGVGDTSILYALDYTHSAINLRGTGAAVRTMRLTGAVSPTRLSTLDSCHVVAFGTQFTVSDLLIDGAGSVGVFSYGGTNGTITNCRVNDTKADSIHMTFASSNITVTGCTIQRSGDDGIAVVSYSNESICHDITATFNTILNNVGGRGMSVVGGRDVLYERNTITNSGVGAGMLVAQESPPASSTLGCLRITYQYNTVTNCGSSTTGHSAIFINNYNTFPNTTIRITRNDIIQQTAGQVGLRVDSGQNVDIIFDQNRIAGATTNVQNQCTPPATVNPYVSGPVGVSGGTTANFAQRIAGPSVVWYHGFDSAAEVNQFRWTNGYIGGNDPLQNGTDSQYITWQSTGGPDGGGYLRATYPVNVRAGGSYWHRPFNPLTGAGNGRGINDPAASGTIALRSWVATDGGGVLYNWGADGQNAGWYINAANQAAWPGMFQGNDFYIQVRVRRPEMPGPTPTAGTAYPGGITGKHVWITNTPASSTPNEIVTFGQQSSGFNNDVVGVQSIHWMYDGRNHNPFGGGANLETITLANPTNWRYTGGWDTLLYHVTPGLQDGTGTNRSRLEVWAQRDLTLFPGESGQYTKIWDTTYSSAYDSGTNSVGSPALPGWNSLICGIYHNGAMFTNMTFHYDYSQIIFSKATIPAPT